MRDGPGTGPVISRIIGILAAIAIPAYQDYTVRAKVSEIMVLAAKDKTSVSEFYISQGVMPSDATAAGFNLAAAQSKYLTGDTTYTKTSDTVASMTYAVGNLGVADATGTVIFRGTGSVNGVSWICSKTTTSASFPAKYLPANCR